MAERPHWQIKRPDGTVACDRCVVADTPVTRMRGLLGRSELEPGEGMLIRPTNSVHMFFMRFAIDVVFVDREMAVRKVVERLRAVADDGLPWRTCRARASRGRRGPGRDHRRGTTGNGGRRC